MCLTVTNYRTSHTKRRQHSPQTPLRDLVLQPLLLAFLFRFMLPPSMVTAQETPPLDDAHMPRTQVKSLSQTTSDETPDNSSETVLQNYENRYYKYLNNYEDECDKTIARANKAYLDKLSELQSQAQQENDVTLSGLIQQEIQRFSDSYEIPETRHQKVAVEALKQLQKGYLKFVQDTRTAKYKKIVAISKEFVQQLVKLEQKYIQQEAREAALVVRRYRSLHPDNFALKHARKKLGITLEPKENNQDFKPEAAFSFEDKNAMLQFHTEKEKQATAANVELWLKITNDSEGVLVDAMHNKNGLLLVLEDQSLLVLVENNDSKARLIHQIDHLQTWHHLAIQFQQQNIRLWFDGKRVEEITTDFKQWPVMPSRIILGNTDESWFVDSKPQTPVFSGWIAAARTTTNVPYNQPFTPPRLLKKTNETFFTINAATTELKELLKKGSDSGAPSVLGWLATGAVKIERLPQ